MIEGRNPATIAATSILHACLLTGYDKITKANISTASQICENTISNAYSKVMECRKEVEPDSLRYKK
jgi:transcription initiation factor TFIIIB Brf1 subunit/transcription initiation factor TFIIB